MGHEVDELIGCRRYSSKSVVCISAIMNGSCAIEGRLTGRLRDSQVTLDGRCRNLIFWLALALLLKVVAIFDGQTEKAIERLAFRHRAGVSEQGALRRLSCGSSLSTGIRGKEHVVGLSVDRGLCQMKGGRRWSGRLDRSALLDDSLRLEGTER